MLGIEYDQAMDEFATGKAAMWESGPWSYEDLMKKNPSLNLGMFPIPGKSEGTGWLIGGPGSSWAVNKASKNKADVMKILEFTSTPEAQAALIKDSFGTSFLKGADSSSLPKQYSDSAEAFNQGHVYVPWANWGVISGDTIITELGKLLQDHLSGAKSIDEVLKGTDKKADELRSNLKK
jgi:raffinose/stachyose/melibiose transport system substrate-binding protein